MVESLRKAFMSLVDLVFRQPDVLTSGGPLVLTSILIILLLASPAQAPCGVVDAIDFPVDTATFQIVQDFGAPSARHGGRFHTGEDWYGGRDASYGTPVRAVAAGRVTYSWPLGWGRDGGVVILEHTFPDGSIAYSQYGHIEGTEQYPFPGKFACVQRGDVVGIVGNARPAPHVHFEIRVNHPDVPGPGYTWEDPTTLGWRRPSEFVLNWQAWLQPAHRWHTMLLDDTGPITPPLLLPDYSMLYLDSYRLRGITLDGRVLWRTNFDEPAVSVTPFQDKVLVTFADGTMQRVNLDGTLADSWETGVPIEGAPLATGDNLIFHTPDNALVAFDGLRRDVQWRLADIPPIALSENTGQLLGLITANHEMLAVSLAGQLINRTQLPGQGSLETAPDGTLIAYTPDGLWAILSDGQWATLIEDVPPAGDSSAVNITMDGRLYLMSNSATISGYDARQALIWQKAFPYMPGETELTGYGSTLLLTGNHGYIIAIEPSSGSICGMTRIYGSPRAKVWHRLGDDGILRVAVADQIIGLDWQTFLGGCA